MLPFHRLLILLLAQYLAMSFPGLGKLVPPYTVFTGPWRVSIKVTTHGATRWLLHNLPLYSTRLASPEVHVPDKSTLMLLSACCTNGALLMVIFSKDGVIALFPTLLQKTVEETSAGTRVRNNWRN